MKPLTVCQFATLTRWGGVERMLVDLLLHANQEKVQHILITTSSNTEVIAEMQKSGISWYQPTGWFRYTPRKFLQMAQWLRTYEVQVVHSYNAFANAWASMTTFLAGTPIFLTGEHGTIWNVQPPIAWLDRWAHQRANLVIANSHASVTMLELKYGISSDKVRVVYNAVADIPPVDTRQVRAQLEIPQEALVVGSVGRLDTPKDYATFIESAAIVLESRQDVVFVLVGGGPLEDELRGCIIDLGIQDRFLMTGWRADARVLMQCFDVFVSTSIREPFGNVLIEAALCEKPVIAPDIDGIPEAVVHEQTGILLHPTEPLRQYRSPGAAAAPQRVLIDGKLQSPRALAPEVLAATILDLLSDPGLRVHYGGQAQDRAQRLFSIERYVRELEDIYLEAAKGV